MSDFPLTEKTEEEVAKISQAISDVDAFKEKCLKILMETYDWSARDILDISVDENSVHMSYEYCVRGCWDKDYGGFPTYWLNEGFDYKADHKRLIEEQRKKNEEEAKLEAERKKIEAEEKERKDYERLKKKFEGGQE